VEQSCNVRDGDRAVLTLLFVIQALTSSSVSQVPVAYFIALDIWLFLTVLFANFATALAEARGKAQAESLRKTRSETPAYRLRGNRHDRRSAVYRPKGRNRVASKWAGDIKLDPAQIRT
jgi:high-affinity K+ transport system ATPase subunit B